MDLASKQFLKDTNLAQAIEQGIKKERLDAIARMFKAGVAKEQIISFGYTEDELAEAENIL